MELDPLDAAGLGVDIFKLGYNMYTNKRDFDYQKALQQQMFEREDTAVQRRMADLKAAGINPNLAAGSAAGAGSVVSRSNTNDLGSALDTAQAVNSIKQQKQAVLNAKTENEIMKKKDDQEYFNKQISLAETMSALGIPYKVHFFTTRDDKFTFKVSLADGYNKPGSSWDQDNVPLNNLFNFNMQNQKNSADLLQKDVDWYTADKISGLTFGLFGLGNSASGWRKAFSKKWR